MHLFNKACTIKMVAANTTAHDKGIQIGICLINSHCGGVIISLEWLTIFLYMSLQNKCNMIKMSL